MINNQSTFMQRMGIYDKMQDRIIILGQNLILNMNLLFYSNSEKYGRKYYYKEYEYISQKAGEPVKKLSREYDAYLSLENMRANENGYKEFIPIRGKDLQLMKLFLVPKLKEIIEKFDLVYQEREGKLYVSDVVKPFQIDVGVKALIFSPGLHKIFNDDKMEPCVDVYLNGDKNNVTSLTFSKVYEFMYIIETFQIYTYASTMLSYMGRPDTGTNLYNMAERQEAEMLADRMNDLQSNMHQQKRSSDGFFSVKK